MEEPASTSPVPANGSEREHYLRELESTHGVLRDLLRQIPAGVVLAEAPSGRLLLGSDQVSRIWRRPFLASDNL